MSTNKCRTDGVAYDCSKLNSKEIQLWSMYQTSASFLVQAGDLHVLISCQLRELSGIISFLKYNGHWHLYLYFSLEINLRDKTDTDWVD